jgi:hypothetical protein
MSLPRTSRFTESLVPPAVGNAGVRQPTPSGLTASGDSPLTDR